MPLLAERKFLALMNVVVTVLKIETHPAASSRLSHSVAIVDVRLFEAGSVAFCQRVVVYAAVFCLIHGAIHYGIPPQEQSRQLPEVAQRQVQQSLFLVLLLFLVFVLYLFL